jgi:hypothetical protein
MAKSYVVFICVYDLLYNCFFLTEQNFKMSIMLCLIPLEGNIVIRVITIPFLPRSATPPMSESSELVIEIEIKEAFQSGMVNKTPVAVSQSVERIVIGWMHTG